MLFCCQNLQFLFMKRGEWILPVKKALGLISLCNQPETGILFRYVIIEITYAVTQISTVSGPAGPAGVVVL